MSKYAKILSAVAGIVMLAVVGQAAVYTQSVDIATDTTWSNGNEYVLTSPIFVTNNAELTIQPGVVVRGYQAGTNAPGALIVSRGSKIHAIGEATNPIVFTDMSDDNVGGSYGSGNYADLNNGICRQWGGLIVLGKTYLASNIMAPTNSPDSRIELQIEGLEPYGVWSKYGGGDDDDDSGEIQYVSIRYGGFVLGDANEINGLTMGAVGRETDIDHVEVFQNKDDGVEFFGGTVNTKYMLIWMVGDDSFDYDEGFRGKGQFWCAVQGPLSSEGDVSDKGSEQDGGMGDSSQPSSIPTIYNVTMVGTGLASDNKKNTALHFRDGTGGRWINGLFMDFGGACGLIEGALGGSYDSANNFTSVYATTAYYTHETDGTRKGDVLNSSFWKFGTNVFFGCAANTQGLAGVWGAEHKGTKTDGNKAHYALPLFDAGYAWMNDDYLTATDCPVKELSRDSTAVTISTKDYYPVDYLDLTLNTTAYPENMVNGRVPPRTDSFFTPVAFRGAFADEMNWAGPWSCAARLGGVDAASEGSDYTGIVPDIYVGTNGLSAVDGTATVAPMTAFQVAATLDSDVYDGLKADYFIVCEAPNGAWYWYSIPSSGWRSGFSCSWQNGTLSDYSESTLFNAYFPFPGEYKFYYLVELNANGQWDSSAPYIYDTITVDVSY